MCPLARGPDIQSEEAWAPNPRSSCLKPSWLRPDSVTAFIVHPYVSKSTVTVNLPLSLNLGIQIDRLIDDVKHLIAVGLQFI